MTKLKRISNPLREGQISTGGQVSKEGQEGRQSAYLCFTHIHSTVDKQEIIVLEFIGKQSN